MENFTNPNFDHSSPTPPKVVNNAHAEIILNEAREQIQLPSLPPGTILRRRSLRKSMRKPAERGLPIHEAMMALARTWIVNQHRLWPELVTSGELPPITDVTINALAEDFATRFLNQQAVPFAPKSALPSGVTLGAIYARYSSGRGNPASLDQQLIKSLDQLRRDNIYVPWVYIFGDAGVTGQTANRNGYNLLKKAAYTLTEQRFTTLYVDEINRMSRDTSEVLSFTKHLQAKAVRLVSVSPALDTNTSSYGLVLAVIAACGEQTCRDTTHRVKRGRDHAFSQGTAVKGPAMGYALAPALDDRGNPIIGAHGKPLSREVIDPETAHYVIAAFKFRGELHWTRDQIARYFNEHKVAGRDTWVPSTFINFFRRTDYIGIEYDGHRKATIDPITGKKKISYIPLDQCRKRLVPHKRIVTDELFDLVQKYEAECGRTYNRHHDPKRLRRHQLHPRSPFSGLLACGYCGHLLTYGRSGGSPTLYCTHGNHCANGCRLRSYKSLAIVGGAIIRYLRQHLFTEAVVDAVVTQANAHLDQLRTLPQPNVADLKAKLRQLEAKTERLLNSLEGETDDALCRKYRVRLREYSLETKALENQIKVCEKPLRLSRENLSKADITAALDNLWALLKEGEVGLAASVLRDLIGPIKITQKTLPGRAKPVWHAEFTPHLLRGISAIKGQIPGNTGQILAHANLGTLTGQPPVVIPLEPVDSLAEKAPEILALVQAYVQHNGTRVGLLEHLKSLTGKSGRRIVKLLRFAEHGIRPKPSPSRPRVPRRKPKDRLPIPRGLPRYVQLAPQIAELRDQKRLSWPAISKEVNLSLVGCKVAYDHFHRAKIRAAGQDGIKVDRGWAGHIPPEKRAELHAELQPYLRQPMPRGLADKLAQRAGCNRSQVHRILRKLRDVDTAS
ncbi:MAG: recombinase family protein [Phycisphaerae bacterium]